jgi:hypothetical protein
MQLLGPAFFVLLFASTVARLRSSSRTMLRNGGASALIYRTFPIWFLFAIFGLILWWCAFAYSALNTNAHCVEVSWSSTNIRCKFPWKETMAGILIFGSSGTLGTAAFLWYYSKRSGIAARMARTTNKPDVNI